MPIRIESKDINKDIEKFIKIFNYLHENEIEYDLIIETKNNIPHKITSFG